MAGISNVIKGFEQCIFAKCDENCPYYGREFCHEDLCDDALKVLKEYFENSCKKEADSNESA